MTTKVNLPAHAPVTIEVVSGPTAPGTIDSYELFFARRALALIKERLGREGILEMLEGDIKLGTEFFREMLAAADGRWQECITELRVEGLGLVEFSGWMAENFHNEKTLLAVQPEHYVISLVDGGQDGVENIGPHIMHAAVQFGSEDDAVGELLPDYPVRIIGYGEVADLGVALRAEHQLRERDGGLDVRLCIYFPAAFPEDVIEAHRQHLAVEFGNCFRLAGEALRSTT
jgi:uncharacterized protein